MLWLLSAVMTVVTARQKQLKAHRLWANTLVLSARLFVVGRLSIGVMSGLLGFQHDRVYWWSIGVASTYAFYRFAFVDILQWERHFRQVLHVPTFHLCSLAAGVFTTTYSSRVCVHR